MKHLNFKELKKIEIKGEDVSDKYVFLPSTEIANALFPEFSFDRATQWSSTNSLHTVELQGFEERIVFENSYNGKNAFRLRLASNVYAPIAFDKQIHLGHQAQDFLDNIKESKKDLMAAIEDAKGYVTYLKNTNIPQFIKDDIRDNVVFMWITKNKNFKAIELDEPTHSANTFYDYIADIIQVHFTGSYTVYTESNGKSKKRRGNTPSNRFEEIKLQQRIYKYLKKNHPELMI